MLDGSLSDTATDRKKGNVDQERSPKSGSGMGKKSNSTSQLSATGKFSKQVIKNRKFFLDIYFGFETILNHKREFRKYYRKAIKPRPQIWCILYLF